ncbi:hypothetical protein AGMMS49959_02040 [Planctomycetales bacterium]|nr:hypothetical protein AGMMS49959_02040 [Planctomycetales bacterium]
MLAIKGIYDGANFAATEAVPVRGRRDVIITFLAAPAPAAKPRRKGAVIPARKMTATEREAALDASFGIWRDRDDVSLAKIRERAWARQ